MAISGLMYAQAGAVPQAPSFPTHTAGYVQALQWYGQRRKLARLNYQMLLFS